MNEEDDHSADGKVACVMNFFTADTGYCLFPMSTVVLRETLQTMPNTEHLEDALEKYSTRGWAIVDGGTDKAYKSTQRFCGDSLCWTIQRENEDSNAVARTDPADIGSWLMRTADNVREVDDSYKIVFGVCEGMGLEYSYVITNDGLAKEMREQLRIDYDVGDQLHCGDGPLYEYGFHGHLLSSQTLTE